MAVQIEPQVEPRIRYRRRFTVDEYYRMAEVGILNEEDRVELVEEEIYEMPPLGWVHVNRVNRLNAVFSRALGDSAIISVQNPIQIDEHSAPQPDLALLRPAEDFITGRLPSPADVLLLVEISDPSINFDLNTKLPLYARAGIPEYWIVDIQADLIRIYTQPLDGVYQEAREARRGETLTALLLPDHSISVDAILWES